jgi:hypothetical protein
MGVTVSGMLGKGSIRHNNRDFIAGNVDSSRTADNIIFIQEDLKTVYHDLFDEALAEYNSRKTKTRDKIPDYYEHISKSKQEKLYYEAIFQIGNKDNCSCGTAAGDKAADALKEFANGFAERNPHLHVFNMTLHMDEATPHIHVDFVPVATNQKRGLSTRSSLRQALIQQGFSGTSKKTETEWTLWTRSEKNVLANLARDRGFEIESHGEIRQKLTVPQYKRAMAELEVVEEKVSAAKNTLEDLNDTAAQLRAAAAVSKAVSTIQPEKTITGAIKGITVDQINDLKLLAASEAAARERVVQLEQENASLRRNVLTVDQRIQFIDQIRERDRKISRLEDALEQVNDSLDQEKSFSKGLFEGITKALIFLEKMLPKNLQHLLKQVKDIIRESVPGIKLPHRSSKDREER